MQTANLDPDELLDQNRVAKMLRCTTKFLEKKRVTGNGPRYAKIGSLCRYRRSDVLAWVEKQSRNSTSE